MRVSVSEWDNVLQSNRAAANQLSILYLRNRPLRCSDLSASRVNFCYVVDHPFGKRYPIEFARRKS